MKRSLITLVLGLSSAIPFSLAQTTPGTPEIPQTPATALPDHPPGNVPGPGPNAAPAAKANADPKVRDATNAINANKARPGEAARATVAEQPNPTTEAEFLNMLGTSNRSQLKLAQLAAQRSQNADVKALAQSTVQDITTSNQSLVQLNRTLGFTPTTMEDATADVTYDRIAKLNGSAFDSAFVQEMQRSQATNLNRFEAAGRFAGTKALKSYLNTGLPALRTSAERADRLRVAAGGTATVPSSGPTTSGTVTGTNPPPVASPVTPGTTPNVNPGVFPGRSPGDVPNATPGTSPNVTPGTSPGTPPAGR